MKKQIHPGVAAALIVIAVIAAGYFVHRQSGGSYPQVIELKDMPMPKAAQEYMGKLAKPANANRGSAAMANPPANK